MQALVVGTLLAVLALAYVLYPLLGGAAPIVRTRATRQTTATPEHEAVTALREIEFDRATGKLSESDYAELRARYAERALSAMRASDATSAPATYSGEDAAEEVVRAYRSRIRSCARCGPRPEPDAVYCSSCGLYLDGRCAHCGATVTEAGATYCAGCGHALAA